jgi:MoxR-like ATPase
LAEAEAAASPDAIAEADAFLAFLAFLAGLADASPEAIAEAAEAAGAEAEAEGAAEWEAAKAETANRPVTKAAIRFFMVNLL